MTEDSLEDIADAIRGKLSVQTQYKPGQMAGAIESIPTGVTPTGTINITENGDVDVTDYATAHVAVSGGGGGGATILSGTSAPTSADGSDGDIYLRYNTLTYTPLDYIQSNGTQYINTVCNAPANAVIECEVNLDLSQPSYATPFGTRVNVGNSSFLLFVGTNGTLYDRNSGERSLSTSIPYGSDVKITAGPYGCEWESGGNSGSVTITGTTPTTTLYPVYLFTLGTGYNSEYGSICRCSMKLYDFKIIENGRLLMWCVPALDTNNAPCLINLVNGEFLYNSGSGSFSYSTAGSQVTKTIIVAAYLKVSGAWQDLIGSDISDVGGVTA